MKYNEKIILFFVCFTFFVTSAQNTQMKVGNNPYTLSSSAVLELESTNKGFLPPRITSAAMNSISSPVQGLVVYCIDCTQGKGLYLYNGTTWVAVSASDTTTSSKGLVQLAGDLTGTAASPSIADATVTGKKLVGFASTTGTISATDSILSAFNKIEGSKSASMTQDSGSTVKYPTVKAVQDHYVAMKADYGAMEAEYGMQELLSIMALPANTSTNILSFTLPSAGVWEVTWQSNIQLDAINNVARAWVTDASGAIIPNSSQRLHWSSNSTQINVGTNTFRIQTTGSQNLNLICLSSGTSGIAYAGTAQSSDYRTNVVYKKISGFVPVKYQETPLTGYNPTPGTVLATDSVLQAIQKLASNLANEVGTTCQYAGSTLPTGYFWCDGAAVSRTAYAALFTAIGTTYGVGNGSTTFNLPDYRGLFLRGRNDFGSVARTDANKDPDTRALGNVQASDYKSHKHGIRQRDIGSTTPNNYSEGQVSELLYGNNYASKITRIDVQTDDFAVGSFVENDLMGTSGGVETRPQNIAVNYIIKF